jgi:hypothetical protein
METMQDIDKLSMSLLLRKTQHEKYLVKTDGQKYVEHQEFLENCQKYKTSISRMTTRMLCPEKKAAVPDEIQRAFDEYARVLIRYFEMEETTARNVDIDPESALEDDDMLFGEGTC